MVSLYLNHNQGLAYGKASFLQPEGDQVEEVDKLTKHETFRGRILYPEIRKLLDKRFNFGGRPPGIKVETAQDTLSSFDILFKL
jgi:hypothetical protein